MFIMVFHVRVNVMDVDLFIKNSEVLIFKWNRSKIKVHDQIEIKSLPFISLFLFAYQLRVGRRFFIIKLAPPSVRDRLMPDSFLNSLQERINKELS